MVDDTVTRIARLEERVDLLIDRFDKRDEKIDQLLELKNKGLGAFWLVSLIFGSSLIAALTAVISWVRG